VIEAHQREDRRVQIVHVDLVLRRARTELIVEPYVVPPLTPPPAIQVQNARPL
jgi:hypothetical protein